MTCRKVHNKAWEEVWLPQALEATLATPHAWLQTQKLSQTQSVDWQVTGPHTAILKQVPTDERNYLFHCNHLQVRMSACRFYKLHTSKSTSGFTGATDLGHNAKALLRQSFSEPCSLPLKCREVVAYSLKFLVLPLLWIYLHEDGIKLSAATSHASDMHNISM